MKRLVFLLVLLVAAVALAGNAPRAAAAILAAYAPETQTPELFANEARTVYLGNLERRKAGQPPLRWNRELTLASRWFSWDSIENRPYRWIGHVDTQGGTMGDRGRSFSYPGWVGAENAAWSSIRISAESLINMWMGSVGHKQNLLSAGHTEIGVGLYARASDNATYAVQMFASDSAFPPLIIENEAPNTSQQQVTLYQHPTIGAGSLTSMGPAAEVAFSNSACFSGAAWQPYNRAEYSHTLPAGEGWKTVYARLRDNLGRTTTAADTIYLGGSPPAAGFNLGQLSQATSAVKLHGLNGNGLSHAQFSLGWAADTFELLWGSGEQISDPAALGQTAYRLHGTGETSYWAYNHGLVPGSNSFVAYFRMKTSDNSSTAPVARITVIANGVGQERSITGTDFSAANQYQEFAYPFSFNSGAADQFIKFQVWQSGSAEIIFDAVTVFTAPQPFSSTHTWNVPGGIYRGQGVWVRYSGESGAPFSGYSEALTSPALSAAPEQVSLLAETGRSSAEVPIQVAAGCAPGWSVAQKPGWLNAAASGDTLRVRGQSSAPGNYNGSLVLQSGSETLTIPVRLVVVNDLEQSYLPDVRK